EGSLVFFPESETTAAILTFVRTRTHMIMASIANWPEVKRFSIGFDIAAAPLPLADGGTVPLGGSLLTVLNSATPEERAGAFAFWEFLMEPDNVRYWVEESFYIPVRRAALPLLEDFYAEDPNRAAALGQLELAVPRPRTGDVTGMRRALLDAVELVLQGGRPVEESLEEAQREAAELSR
ncbi:MAG TPA: extracellular solute-binding protein, partial [Deinococcales bacterium]|nr:extracellular solute-binding protein [Deinococcales bacterium]